MRVSREPLRMPALIIAAVSLAVGFSSAFAKSNEIKIPLGDYGGRPTVELTINDQGPFTFILDTGSEHMLIDLSVVEALGLDPQGETLIGGDAINRVPGRRYNLDNVSINGMELDIHGASGLDLLGYLPPGENRPVGVVGYWQLGAGVTSYDVAESMLTIAPNESLDPNDDHVQALRRYEGVHFPRFDINLGGRKMEAFLDTGNPKVLVMNIEESDNLKLKSELVESGKASLIGSEQVLYGADLDGVATLGEISIANPPILFLNGHDAVNVGMGFIENAVVKIDHENMLIKFEKKKA